MRSVFANRRSAIGGLGCIGLLVGCARPQGELFPRLDAARVWPAPPEQERIRLVGVLRGSDDLHASVSAGEALGCAVRGRRPPIRFVAPHAIAVRDDDVVAVADPGAGVVHILDLIRRTHVLVSGFGEERFRSPVGVTWMGERIVVSDAGRHELVLLNVDGSFVSNFGAQELHRPVGVCFVESRNQLYVVDGDEHQVKIFSPEGRMIGAWGSRGSGSGELNYPTQLAVSEDRVLIADSGNFRVQLLTLDGSMIREIGRKGDAAGDFALPKGVAFDRDGHLYVADAQFENIQVFDDRGRLLLAVGEEGGGPGEFALPAGLAMDAKDRLWVADAGNHRLQVFHFVRTGS